MTTIAKEDCIFLIMNPGSRGGKSKKLFKKIFSLLDHKELSYEFAFTRSLNDAFDLSQKANKENYKAIIAVGGDGTINKVINGFFDRDGNRLSNSKFGVIYTGTSPDFCKSYSIPLKPEYAVEIISKFNTIMAYTGKIEYSDTNPQINEGEFISDKTGNKVSYFVCCANIGLGAELARRANGGIRKYLGDFLGTFLSLIAAIIKYNPSSYKIRKDNTEKSVSNVLNLSIGRTHYIASGIQVKNSISFDQKGFYLLTTQNLSIKKLPNLFNRIYSGSEIINDEILNLSYTKKLEVAYNSQNPEIEMDGDPVGFLPCKISSSNNMLEIISDAD